MAPGAPDIQELLRRLCELGGKEREREFWKAHEFIQGWQLLLAELVAGVSEESGSWVTYVANNQSGAALLGIQARREDHWPVQLSACVTRCVICDEKAAEAAGAEESSTSRWARQQQAVGELGEAVSEGLRLGQEDAEFAREVSTPEGSRREAREVERVKEDLERRAAADPAVARAIRRAQEFIKEWRAFELRHKEFPRGKVYAAFVANNASGAACIGQVPDPAQHLPAVKLGCPVDCSVCERFQTLGARVIAWREAHALVEASVWYAKAKREQEARNARLQEVVRIVEVAAEEAIRQRARGVEASEEQRAAAKREKRRRKKQERRARAGAQTGESVDAGSAAGGITAEGSEDTASASSGVVVNRPERASLSAFWWEEEDWADMAAVSEGKQRFSGRKNEGLTLEQFELQVEGSILDRFTKLQKDLGRPVEGAEFKKRFCVHLGEHMDNPAKEAHLRAYKECNTKEEPVKQLLANLKRHFGERNEGKAQEWVNFRREAGEELPELLFRLQGLAGDLKKPLTDPELVTKFVAALDKRLGDAVNTHALAAASSGDGGYTLDNAYDAAVRVSEMASRLRIAREMTPRPAEVRPRWGGRAPVAHAAVPEVQPAAAAIVMTAGSAGSGACHTCGEMGHYRNTCPQRGGGSGRGGPGRGTGRSGPGRGARGPRICFVCGDPAHLSFQCPQRHVAPAAAAVPAGGGGGAELAAAGLSMSEVEEFRAWKAAAQAAAALSLEDDDTASWDGDEYELGAAALPTGGDVSWRPTSLCELGAVATRASAGADAPSKEARAIRPRLKPRKQGRAGTRPRQVVGPATGQPVGTAALERKAPVEALRQLRARTDKAALKERMAKLPDQGREVAAQGLHRLPQGFSIRTEGTPGASAQAEKQGVIQGVATSTRKVAGAAPPVVVIEHPAEEVRTGGAAILLGQVTVDVEAFLQLADRAGLSLQQVVAMTGGVGAPQPQLDPREVMRRAVATAGGPESEARRPTGGEAGGAGGAAPVAAPGGAVGAAPGAAPGGARSVAPGRAPGAAPGGTSRVAPGGAVGAAQKMAPGGAGGSTPIADVRLGATVSAPVPARALSARASREVVGSGESVMPGEAAEVGPGAEEPRGEHNQVRVTSTINPGVNTDPESSWMAQARADCLRQAQIRSKTEEADKQLALEMLVEEARSVGVDSATALRAQAGPVKTVTNPRRWEMVSRKDKGKGKLGVNGVEGSGEAERGGTAEAWEASHALAAFAEALPKVPPTERSRWVGTPDWVENRDGAVKVMTVAGLKAPLRVLIDGGSFYSMAGARLAPQLGLPVESNGVLCKVQTALGKVEPLGKGFTRDPVPIVLNAGTPAELTLYEHLAVTESTGYDLLIETRAAYPIGLSIDRWSERGTYRVDWRSRGEHVASIPMRLRQPVGQRAVRGSENGAPTGTAGVALACSATQ
ncbi:hypothetical protein KFL_010620020 [Klebsormidium nitens]|uniref:CCHC-type domain-containing protein n=1 Tax=Klebsormidium nitens TaxID=105231 RepID=A0A1Y1INV6_KLENI|nr:hypothetical protein KFL_010620020 [Klebsormidium nitens]|eukprot:GAQ92585.1 hypothetical protein KFL_010620020 [Klebsormidium nitens]